MRDDTAHHWSRTTVYLIGGGPSLRGFDFKKLIGRGITVGVNRAMFDCDCDCGVTIDQMFMQNYWNELEWFARRRDLYLIQSSGSRIHIPCSACIQSDDSLDCRITHDRVVRGGTSGYAALSLAVVKGARRIVLLGYDYCVVDGVHHYHDGYEWYNDASNQSWSFWAKQVDDAAPQLADLGVRVLNVSPISALTAYPKVSLDDVISESLECALH